MKTCLNISTLLVLLTTASGCARIRELTRRDYAMLRDPFASKTATDDTEDTAPPVEATASTSGYVKLNDTNLARTAPSATADYSQVPDENPAAPAGSAFPGIRVRGMEDAMTSKGRPPTVTRGVTSLASLSKTIPETSADSAEGFDNFAQQRNAPVNSLGENAGSDEMLEIMSTEKQRWEAEYEAVADKATAAGNPIRQVSKTVQQNPRSAEAAGPSGSPFAELEAARPLIKSQAATPLIRKRNSIEAPAPAQKPESTPPVGDSNPFAELEPQASQDPAAPVFDEQPPSQTPPPNSGEANPFADFDQPASKSTNSQALDAGFNFDTGWRPADAELR